MSVLAAHAVRRLSVARIAGIAFLLALLLLGMALLATGAPSRAAVTATVINGAITARSATLTGKFVRDGSPSVCGTNKSVPALANNTVRHYNAYPFTNTSPGNVCVTVQLQTACSGTNDIFSLAYLGAFDPANITAGYLADEGKSPGQTGGANSYSFTVPSGANYTVIVYEVTRNAGCAAYTLTVNDGGSTTPSPSPTATRTNTPTRTRTPTPAPPTVTATTMPPSATPTGLAPSATPSASRTPSRTPTRTRTRTATVTATPAPSTATPPATSPTPAGSCTIFPADNIWNRDISGAPVSPQSAAYINSINPNAFLHAGFASRLWQGFTIGLPITTVGLGQALVPIRFTDYPSQSDPGPYPVPTAAGIQGGPNASGDRHVIVWDQGNCREYDMYAAYPHSDGSWDAGAGATWSLTSNALRPDGWTSADAAGLPILPGLVRYDEVAAGSIRHAIRFTAYGPAISGTHVWPARLSDGQGAGPAAIPMGSRLRLKASVDLSGFDPQVQVILRALQTYGMILADSDSANDELDIGGEYDARWDDPLLQSLGALHSSDFEVVDVSGLMIDPNSAQSR